MGTQSESEPTCLSLSGCGFLGIYHFGAIDCLRSHAGNFLQNVSRVAGTSAGSLVAAVMVVCPEKLEVAECSSGKTNQLIINSSVLIIAGMSSGAA